MKSLPTEEENYRDVVVQDDSIDEPEITCEVQNGKNYRRPSLFRNGPIVNNECQNSSESDSLIVCNPDLAASFRSIKAEKLKLSPGHYLQKVFLNSVAQKFRSQSLPNCFDKKKHKCSLTGVVDEASETSAPLVETTESVPVNLEIKESSDVWFKTWPERNTDKVPNNKEENHTNIETNCHDIDTYSNKQRNLCSLEECENEEKLNSELSCNLLAYNNVSSAKLRVPLRKCDLIESCLHQHEKSKPIQGKKELDEPKKNLISNTQVGNAKSIPLDDLLDNFPLAYSPVTKQLLLIQSHHKGNSKVQSDAVNVNPAPLGLNNILCDLDDCAKVLNLEETVSAKFGGGKGLTNTQGTAESDLVTSTNILHGLSTDVSSFSSTVSSLSDNSPSTNEDSALGSLLDHGDTCSLVSVGGSSAFSEDSVGAKPKKKGLTGFFSKNVFNWKSGSRSEDSITQSGPTWKLFGKNSSPQSSLSSLTVDHYVENDAWSLAPDSPCSVRSGGGSTPRTFSHESRVASSSALIQLDRPANLPAKSEEEEARHRLEYQQMVEAARKKELKEAKQRKKQAQLQLRAEEQLAQATRVWTREILPRWEQMSTSKKARELWWQGVPPCVRGKVWKLAIGNPLNLTHSLYDICVQRAQDRLRCGGTSSDDEDSDNKEASMQLIQLDISRTFPHLCIFQKGGPYYDMLHCLLAAYVCYRPDVGYVQGMSFIAAVLILNMEAPDAFVSFANLLNSPCHMAFFHLNQPLMQAYYSTYNELLKENLPQLYDYFTTTTLTPDLYLLDWIYTVFTKAMNLDLASRIWDVFLRDGDQFLFQTALGVLHLCQDTLLQMDFVHGSQFLTRLPDDLCGDQLFKSISCIRMTVGKQRFEDILATHSVDCN